MSLVILLPSTTTADIAQAVRDLVAVELARLDVPVSTRATPEDVAGIGIRGDVR